MARKKGLRMASKAKSQAIPSPTTPKSDTGQIDRYFYGRELPGSLNYLDKINDFSDCVDFFVKSDKIAHGKEPIGSEGSHKKCRFCS